MTDTSNTGQAQDEAQAPRRSALHRLIRHPHLGIALTEAITRVVGDDLRTGTMVELVASPPERTFVGGVLTM
ncbi:hypothetical protein OG381_01485 [Streptomyces sp. NBC_00490]|uniref:hypothetical protein n=1 Tax=Streptomyces sp. NBC_00490 TaxID=2903657 RepID=UPI002E18F8BF